MKPSGRLLYRSMDEKSRRTFTMMAVMSAFMAAVALVVVDYLFIRMGKPLHAVIVTVLFVLCVPYTVRILLNKDLRIYENGVTIPTPFSGFFSKFIPFRKISGIRLITEQGRPNPNIVIETADKKEVRYPKSYLSNWDEFYRVLTEDLRGKVRVVE